MRDAHLSLVRAILGLVSRFSRQAYYVRLMKIELDVEELKINVEWWDNKVYPITEKEKESFISEVRTKISWFWKQYQVQKYSLYVDTKHDSVSWREILWPLYRIPRGIFVEPVAWDRAGVGHIERPETWFKDIKAVPEQLWRKQQPVIGDVLGRVRDMPKESKGTPTWVPFDEEP